MASFSNSAFAITAFANTAFFVGEPIATADCDLSAYSRICMEECSSVSVVVENSGVTSLVTDNIALTSRMIVLDIAAKSTIEELTGLESKPCQ